MKNSLITLSLSIVIALSAISAVSNETFRSSSGVVVDETPTPLDEWKVFRNDVWDYAISYPDSWLAQVDLQNGEDIPDSVFRERLMLSEPDNSTGATVVVWNKSSKESLTDWLLVHQKHWFPEDLDKISRANAVVAGLDAVAVEFSTPDDSIARFVYIDNGSSVFRITYGGNNTPLWSLLIQSFQILSRPSSTTSLPEDIPMIPVIADEVEDSCVYQNASENSCCAPYNSSPVYYFQCSRNTTTNVEYGNCVWWAAHERRDVGTAAAVPGLGSAKYWDNHAHDDGFLVDDCARERRSGDAGDILVSEAGSGGHVAYVTVANHTKVTVTEMNWCESCVQTNPNWDIAGRKFIHTTNKTVVLYWDPPNAVANEFNVPGACNGRREEWLDSVGWKNVEPWFDNQATAVLVPDGWSVRLFEHTNRGGASKCLNASDTNFADDTFAGTGIPLNDNVSSYEVFSAPNCPGDCCGCSALRKSLDGPAISADSVCRTLSYESQDTMEVSAGYSEMVRHPNEGYSVAFMRLDKLEIEEISSPPARLDNSPWIWDSSASMIGGMEWQLSPAASASAVALKSQLQTEARTESVYEPQTARAMLATVPASSPNYMLTSSVFGMGGGEKTSDGYKIRGTSGQFSGTGQLQSTSYQVASGFWAGVIEAPCYDFGGQPGVDVFDINAVAGSWGSTNGLPGYNTLYDVNSDNRIDIVDVMIVAAAWGTFC